jgi:hypothetical protein
MVHKDGDMMFEWGGWVRGVVVVVLMVLVLVLAVEDIFNGNCGNEPWRLAPCTSTVELPW